MVPLLRHLNVFEHDLESGGELESAFLLQLPDHFLLCVFKDPPRVEESLGKAVLVEVLKDVLVLEVPENLYDFVDFLGDLDLGVVLEVLLELLVQVHHKGLGRLLVLVDEALE